MKLNGVALFIFWTILILLSAWFYFDNAVAYLFGYRNERFPGNEFWFVAHIVGATCSLFLGPIQFWKFIRTKYLKFHRLVGKIYVVGTLLAAVSAFRLALIFDCIACRFSLIPLSFLLFITTALAWYTIKQKNIVAHKQFMVRSYSCALAFVFVRLYQVIPLDFMFGVIDNPEIEGIVTEWMFSILPLIIVEIVMIWLPSLRKTNLLPK
ncbi:MAG TPA: DUF2306 domain-containing protein [Chryseolinea sp.]|nr:DUF2306 domain-containing protein [Chryseolinea sp.]HPM29698.1 DUF2306 domain-containing protein [Chryseolinea sp.]